MRISEKKIQKIYLKKLKRNFRKKKSMEDFLMKTLAYNYGKILVYGNMFEGIPEEV